MLLSDFVFILDWLSLIGEANRRRIRHLHLHFSGYRHTSPFAESKDMGHNFATGAIFEGALNLLAKSHRIDTFKVSGDIHGPAILDYNAAFAHLFLPPESRKRKIWMARGCTWQNALKRIVGIKRLICTELEVDSFAETWSYDDSRIAMEESRFGFEEVKKAMEMDCTHQSEQASTDVDQASLSI